MSLKLAVKTLNFFECDICNRLTSGREECREKAEVTAKGAGWLFLKFSFTFRTIDEHRDPVLHICPFCGSEIVRNAQKDAAGAASHVSAAMHFDLS